MKMKALSVALAMTALSCAAATINVTPWSAPNAFGSPSFDPAVQNQEYALMHGLTSYGNPALPTYYQAAPSNLSLKDNIVTGYPSWKGDANPSTTFGPAFASELGNRLHFGILITGDGAKISIDQLGFNAVSTDPGNTLGFSFATGSYVYSASYMGWNYGSDGLPNTGDDSFVTSGSNSQLVDAIVGRGSGNAWASYDTDPGATRQDKLDGVVNSLYQDEFDFTGTYTLGNDTGSATVTFNSRSVPDGGATAGLMALGIGSLAIVRRRK